MTKHKHGRDEPPNPKDYPDLPTWYSKALSWMKRNNIDIGNMPKDVQEAWLHIHQEATQQYWDRKQGKDVKWFKKEKKKPIEAVPYVRRFPRRLRFPRIPPAERRNEVGTLLCVCNKPGRIFVQDLITQRRLAKKKNKKVIPIGESEVALKCYQFRGFCSGRCADRFLMWMNEPTHYWRERKMVKEPGWTDFVRKEK